MKVKVKVEFGEDMPLKYVDKFKIAFNQLEAVINSKELKDEILSMTWKSWYKTRKRWWHKWSWEYKVKYGFRWNKGYTRKSIYNIMMAAEEKTGGNTAKNVVEIYQKVDRRYVKGVVGYMWTGQKWQWVYEWVMKKSTAYLAMNAFHEWWHHMYFSHEWEYNKYREYTVPYWMGYKVRDIINDWSKKGYFEKSGHLKQEYVKKLLLEGCGV